MVTVVTVMTVQRWCRRQFTVHAPLKLSFSGSRPVCRAAVQGRRCRGSSAGAAVQAATRRRGCRNLQPPQLGRLLVCLRVAHRQPLLRMLRERRLARALQLRLC